MYKSASWHLYDFDSAGRRVSLLQLQEADYHEASFLDQRIEGKAQGRMELAVSEFEHALCGVKQELPEPHFIFHLGHCGSTLLSRALAANPKVLPVREPLTLRRLADDVANGRDSGLSRLLEITLSAHSRVFHPEQVTVIKATSTCNNLIPTLLSAREHSRAVLMYVPLETYLAGMLGKLTPPLDLRGHAEIRLADWSGIEAAPPLLPAELDITQLAVLAWLLGMRHLLAASAQFQQRTLLLDFQQFLAQPEAELIQVATFFELQQQIPSLLNAWPEIATSYSKKPDEPYSAFNRRKTLQRGRMNHGQEIKQGLHWAQTMIENVEALQGCVSYLGN